MSAQKITVDLFLEKAEKHLVLDARSPSEFAQAHIPNALSLPLFSDEERKIVGTTYKQNSRAAAIKIGLDFFGPKMRAMVEQVETYLQEKNEKKVLVHCWRGGMRSAAVAWLLDLYGFEVYLLQGGYKAYRNWVLEQLAKAYPLHILSGNTGCGKTEMLYALAKNGEAIIDLEALAGHKGSAFGNLGLPAQSSTEQFENNLAAQLFQLMQNPSTKRIWVESESNRIGNINIHHTFFNQMKQAPCLQIAVPLEKRIEKIVAEYGSFPKEDLIAAVIRIQKRLGPLETKQTLAFLELGAVYQAFEILMRYYDKFYQKSDTFLAPYLHIDLPTNDAEQNAQIIFEKINERK